MALVFSRHSPVFHQIHRVWRWKMMVSKLHKFQRENSCKYTEKKLATSGEKWYYN
ncbi:hypothetical protein CLOLEP_01039 [[Clostridium] leptum DSM 753]|uniref:Uncharacterized protein n=1 Tax=[Clostridium] leptum DSM 753 TaxID=428125 RepID=A7VR56_9FIRM|nr:hypothetical protein CLOLEP_01039 [[Clostridium] leptum DSM 753]